MDVKVPQNLINKDGQSPTSQVNNSYINNRYETTDDIDSPAPDLSLNPKLGQLDNHTRNKKSGNNAKRTEEVIKSNRKNSIDVTSDQSSLR